MTRMCRAVNHHSQTRCTRGVSHIDNGMPHKDKYNSEWMDGVVEKIREKRVRVPKPRPLTPRQQFRLDVLEALRKRLKRARGREWEVAARYVEAMRDAIDAIERDRVNYGRLHGQTWRLQEYAIEVIKK